MKMRVLVVTLLLLPSLLAQDSKPATLPPKGSSVDITIIWAGTRPVQKPFEIPRDYLRTFANDGGYCQKCVDQGKLKDESLIIGKEGGIQNVAVSFPRIKTDIPGLPAVTITNKDCRFAPHIQFAPVGKAVRLTNEDELSHNAKVSRRKGRPLANRLIPPKGASSTPVVPRPGIYAVTCDIHPWMKGWLIGSRNPYCAITNEKGKARIKGVPPGKDLILAVWHESLGAFRKKVVVKPNGTLVLKLTQNDLKLK